MSIYVLSCPSMFVSSMLISSLFVSSMSIDRCLIDCCLMMRGYDMYDMKAANMETVKRERLIERTSLSNIYFTITK